MKRFGDFHEGECIALGPYVVSEREIVAFASQYDPQAMHTDPEAAKMSPMGELIASGWHTCAMAMRMLCDAFILQSTSVAAPGVEQIRWLSPVRPGDTLSGECRIINTRRSASKPDRGIVRAEVAVNNQHGVQVLAMQTTALYLV